jgi:hypothetical protein
VDDNLHSEETLRQLKVAAESTAPQPRKGAGGTLADGGKETT